MMIKAETTKPEPDNEYHNHEILTPITKSTPAKTIPTINAVSFLLI